MLRFFKSLALILEIKLYFISGYHPEVDGQTEYTN